MYLVSIYFDEKTNKKIHQYIQQVAKKSGNQFMLEGNVLPHITISAFETKQEDKVIKRLESQVEKMEKGMLTWASIGVFPPSVVFLAPVLNSYLHTLSEATFQCICEVEETLISKYYQPFQWMPHTTIGKKLSSDEMKAAFAVLQHNFHLFSGEVVRIGVAKTNPYEEIVNWDLK